jgi:hypothetical protein
MFAKLPKCYEYVILLPLCFCFILSFSVTNYFKESVFFSKMKFRKSRLQKTTMPKSLIEY